MQKVTPRQQKILSYIAKYQPMRMQKLQEKLFRSGPATSLMVSRMAEKGLIKKSTEGRRVILSLSKKGTTRK